MSTYNLIVVASRPAEWTHEQFITWWRGEHAEVTYPLPGLRRWLHTELVDGIDEKSTGWDGMSVLSFDSREALDTALASDEWLCRRCKPSTRPRTSRSWRNTARSNWRARAAGTRLARSALASGSTPHTR